MQPQLCVGAVAVENRRLLLIRRGQDPGRGLWSVPGGRVEAGETLAEAIVREVREEAGLDVVCDRFLGWVEHIDNTSHFVILDFVVTVLDPSRGRRNLRAGHDAIEAAWVPLEEVTDYPLVDGLTDFLAEHGIIRLIY